MATKHDATRARIDSIKAQLASTTTCSSDTVDAIQELLARKNEEATQKENVRARVQPTARRRAGTASAGAAAAVGVTKQTCPILAPREKYILATEAANLTLKSLADALKHAPASATARPSPRTKASPKTPATSHRPLMERSASQTHNSPQKRLPRRSSSYSSFSTAGPEAGLVATAECARLAFSYLGTPEAAKVLGKDSQELQYENGVIVLIGKLVALGLDTFAVKELKTLKRRLDIFLRKERGAHEATNSTPQSKPNTTVEKENLAMLLDFGVINMDSSALSIVATFQTYVLRIIAKLRRPQITEIAWSHLKLSNPSSVANLIWHTAQVPTAQTKAARQLESLAQTILTLCPSVSASEDERASQPSPEIVLSLQQLAFRIRKRWWTLVRHQGNEEQDLVNPFNKCIMAFARRSSLSPSKKYKLAESLYQDLCSQQAADDTPARKPVSLTSPIAKTLSALAQAAGSSDAALRWLGAADPPSSSNTSAARSAARTVRISTVSLEAYLKDNNAVELPQNIDEAIEALNGSLGGTAAELDSLFLEANAFRRAATRLLITNLSSASNKSDSGSDLLLANSTIAACIHFSARFVASKCSDNHDKSLAKHRERMSTVWKYLKSMVDSVLACCKQNITDEENWQNLDKILQECSHIVRSLENEIERVDDSGKERTELISSTIIKISNAYWSVYLQLRKAKSNKNVLIAAMERSIQLLQSRSPLEAAAGHVAMKLEQLGETLEDLDRGPSCLNAFAQCIQCHLDEATIKAIETLTAKTSLYKIFDSQGSLSILARVLKAFHRSFLKLGGREAGDLGFYDNADLPPATRGALLEWQLGFFLRTLAKNRQWNPEIDSSIKSLINQLSTTYTPDRFPIRHLRFSNMLLSFSHDHSHVISEALRQSCLEDRSELVVQAGADGGLKRYSLHLQNLRRFKSLMQQSCLSVSDLRQCLASWETFLNNASSWNITTDQVDDIDDWLQVIQAAIDLLNARGEEYLALGVLHLQVRILELQNESDPSELVSALCSQGLQFLRLGYTGKSRLSLAKAETLMERQTASVETALRWHISSAEYLLAIGNSKKCTTIMADAQSLALTDRSFMDLAKPSTTLSGRVRFNRVLADATYVLSLLAASTGSYQDAARHAKQCVSLNRRIWAALESRVESKKPVKGVETNANTPSFDPLSSLRSDSGVPLVMSVTHEALSGPEFWSLGPALYRGMMQHSQLLINQGLLHEAIYLAEQADKVASAIGSPTLQVDNASWRADCWAQSGRQDKAEQLLTSVEQFAARKCLSSVGYYSAVARTHHHNGRLEDELESYAAMERILEYLASPDYIRTLETFLPAVDELTRKMEEISIGNSDTQNNKKTTATRGRTIAAKSGTRAAAKSVPRAQTKTVVKTAVKARSKSTHKNPTSDPPKSPGVEEQSCTLSAFRANVLDRKVLTSISQDKLVSALDLLNRAEELHSSSDLGILHVWATFKARLAQSLKQIADDFTVNTLPESTIAFPAIGIKEGTSVDALVEKKIVPKPAATAKPSRITKQVKENFVDMLHGARERLVEAHALCATKGSNHIFQQVSMALSEITVLLSAVSGTELRGSLHPLYAAFMSEIPKCNSLRLMQDSVEAEKFQMSRDECLKWPTSVGSISHLSSITEFQHEYVDIIPDTWSVVSMALNENQDELYVTRFEGGLSPFVLRLPLARQASREMDEEEFSFQDGKRDFDEIIELSDFSTRTAKDMTSRDARQQWWAEREALDNRLHELLVNIENIWLGGFKGIFSPHERQPALLARFRKSLETILNEHLPSRKKKSQQKRPVLDPRVLDLFIGLGNANDAALDLDEALMDLIYFIVDILQFNGERNAYDEIDFDSIVVEVHDALRAYHSESNASSESSSRHTILILDKHLHCFPWESLPCLEPLSISRLPSLAALRERLMAARRSVLQDALTPGHHIRTNSGGTSILNPSGDLTHTLKTLKPHLDNLQGPWAHIANRVPSEKEFEDSLREQDLVLYFGHGSGAQYIKSKTVRRLYPGPPPQNDANHSKPSPACATTLLFGCSSVHLTDNGIYEPSGMLASYLIAGAPAVLGMLWDVTDKDCDRFAVRAGELWGLWPPEQQKDDNNNVIAIPPFPPKTPAKKTKGKTRVAQLVDEVEGVRSSPSKSTRKGRNALDKAAVGDNVAAAKSAKVQMRMGLDEAVREARKACVLRYLNGAAAVVYGIPVYLD